MTNHIRPNPHNHYPPEPFVWPLTGDFAIAAKRPVAGSVRLRDGRRLLIAEGETCLVRSTCQPWAWPENIVDEESVE